MFRHSCAPAQALLRLLRAHHRFPSSLLHFSKGPSKGRVNRHCRRSCALAQARTKVPSMAIGGIRLCNFTTFACMSLFIVYIFPDTLFSPKYT